MIEFIVMDMCWCVQVLTTWTVSSPGQTAWPPRTWMIRLPKQSRERIARLVYPSVMKHGVLENGPCISDFPMKPSSQFGVSLMFDYQMAHMFTESMTISMWYALVGIILDRPFLHFPQGLARPFPWRQVPDAGAAWNPAAARARAGGLAADSTRGGRCHRRDWKSVAGRSRNEGWWGSPSNPILVGGLEHFYFSIYWE